MDSLPAPKQPGVPSCTRETLPLKTDEIFPTAVHTCGSWKFTFCGNFMTHENPTLLCSKFFTAMNDTNSNLMENSRGWERPWNKDSPFSWTNATSQVILKLVMCTNPYMLICRLVIRLMIRNDFLFSYTGFSIQSHPNNKLCVEFGVSPLIKQFSNLK